ncbi:TPA: hypothetical protein ACU3BL_003575 [Salmonella enterica]|nr:hypothetical protein [Salmonella enterica subsp. enterica serovar Amager]
MKRILFAMSILAVTFSAIANTFQCSGNGLSHSVDQWNGLNTITIDGDYFQPTGQAQRLDNSWNQQNYHDIYNRRSIVVFYGDEQQIYKLSEITDLSDKAIGKFTVSAEEIKQRQTFCPAIQLEENERKEVSRERAQEEKDAKDRKTEQEKQAAILKQLNADVEADNARREAAKTW